MSCEPFAFGMFASTSDVFRVPERPRSDDRDHASQRSDNSCFQFFGTVGKGFTERIARYEHGRKKA